MVLDDGDEVRVDGAEEGEERGLLCRGVLYGVVFGELACVF